MKKTCPILASNSLQLVPTRKKLFHQTPDPLNRTFSSMLTFFGVEQVWSKYGASLAQALALNGRPKLDPCPKFAQTCPGSPNLPQHPLNPLLCCKSFFFTITIISNQALSNANDSRDHGCQIRVCTFFTMFKITVGVGARTFSPNPLFKITILGKHPSKHLSSSSESTAFLARRWLWFRKTTHGGS